GPSDTLCTGLYAGSLSSTEALPVSAKIDGNVGFASNHIFFAAEGGLKAQAFDLDRLQVAGQPVPVVQHEMAGWDRAWCPAGFSLSEAGTLIFQSRTHFAAEFTWTDASGNEQGKMQGAYWEPAISPDGRSVAFVSDEFQDGKWYICRHDLERGVTTRL